MNIIGSIRSWMPSFVTVGIGYAVQQGLGMLTAILLIRWLPVEQYGFYTLAMSIVAIMMVVADLGLGGALPGVIGEGYSDATVMSQYLAAGWHYRRRLLLASIGIGILFFVWLPGAHQMGKLHCVGIFGLALISVWWQAGAGFHAVPLMMHQRLATLQVVQCSMAVLRLALCCGLFWTGRLGCISILMVNAVTIGLTGFIYSRLITELVVPGVVDSTVARQRLFKVASPKIVPLVYGSFAGQIPILLGAVVSSTVLAEVGALSRIQQLFAFIQVFAGMVIVPRFARMSDQSASWKIPLLIFLGTAALGGVVGFFNLFPQPILWLLGAKYSYLSQEVGLVVLIGAIGSLGMVIGSLNESRCWNYWYGSWIMVGIGLLGQVYGVRTFDLKTSAGLLHLNLVTATVVLVVNLGICLWGLRERVRGCYGILRKGWY